MYYVVEAAAAIQQAIASHKTQKRAAMQRSVFIIVLHEPESFSRL